MKKTLHFRKYLWVFSCLFFVLLEPSNEMTVPALTHSSFTFDNYVLHGSCLSEGGRKLLIIWNHLQETGRTKDSGSWSPQWDSLALQRAIAAYTHMHTHTTFISLFSRWNKAMFVPASPLLASEWWVQAWPWFLWLVSAFCLSSFFFSYHICGHKNLTPNPNPHQLTWEIHALAVNLSVQVEKVTTK